MAKRKQLYGIWCKEANKDRGDWLRDGLSIKGPILAFESRAAAYRRAAQHYGFPSYTEAKLKDWCEVICLGQR